MEQKKEIYRHNIPDTDKPRIVVIGGGFGGLNFLKHLRGNDYQVVLFDRYNYHTFQPLLYQVATAGLEPDAIAGPLRQMIGKRKDWHFRMLRVDRIDPQLQEIQTAAGKLHFDYLVIATGSKMNYFNNESIAKNAYPVKQITHALDLRHTIFQQFERLELMAGNDDENQGNLNFVVAGAGPTGVEVCGALAELRKHVLPNDYPDLDIGRMQIYLVEGLSQVLPSMSEASGKKAQQYLENFGVKVILDCLTESYDGRVVQLSNGDKIITNTLIWAAGVKPNMPDGIPGEFTGKKGFRVNHYNQVCNENGTSVLENIFVIGDSAFMQTEKYEQGLPGLAPVAIQQGKHLAGNMKRAARGKALRPFTYINKGVLATIGRNKAVADFPRNIKLSGLAGWITWMLVHLLYLVGFRNKTIVFTNWFWNYVTYDRGIRLIIRPSPKSRDLISKELVHEMTTRNE